MNTVELILVVLLGSGLVILLILSIIVVSLLIKIMSSIKRISDRAESATTNVAGIAETISAKLAPLAASGLLSMIIKQINKNKKQRRYHNGSV